jgi:hypothetical protein
VRFLRIVTGLLAIVAGLAFVAHSPRRVTLELVEDHCYVTRGHPLSPEKSRVLDCRLEARGEEIVVHGSESDLFLDAGRDAAHPIDRVRTLGSAQWNAVDGFDLVLAAFAFVAGILLLRSSRARDPEEEYVDELVDAFRA